MRFKNLTITITLGVLSMVAVAGLVMLPITGNCELFKHGWNYYNNNTAGNIMVTEDTKGASWQVYATLDAANESEDLVYASISTDDYNLSHFTEDKIFTGTGLVTAFRDNRTYLHYHGRTGDTYGIHSHTVSGAIDTNHKYSPYFNGGNDALTLDIEANAQVDKHTGWGYKKEDSTKKVLRVSIKKTDDIVEIGGEFTAEFGTTKYIATQQSEKIYVHIPVVAQEEGVSASVTFHPKADSSAHADFDFDGHSFDGGSVWYDASE